MNLIIDIGNTLIKLAVFEGDQLIKTIVENHLDKSTIDEFRAAFNIEKGIYSSVTGNKVHEDLLKKYNFLQLTHRTRLPLEMKYKTPETLGIDRIAAVVGAGSLFKNSDLLVIDLGTCVTYDFMNAQNEYIGGSISPGFQMRFKALEHFTGKLPLINYNKEKLMLSGNSTETAIISGVYHGLEQEVSGIISSYLSQYPNLKVVVTGGDNNLFDLAPKNRIFADEFLVLKGLNEILKYNEQL